MSAGPSTWLLVLEAVKTADDVRFWSILLQKPQTDERQISRQNTKQAAITN
jgi:hypothetical protein